MPEASTLLELTNVEAVYDGAILALRGVSLSVAKGGITALLGANGAGKTTTLKAVSNLLRSERGEVRGGSIRFNGEPIDRLDAAALVARGVVQVLEGRRVFPQLTVEENVLSGAFVRKPTRAELARELERVYAWFPRLKQRRKSAAGLTSGGEQQMIAIGRALMTRPVLVLLDEPSMGLAPLVVEEIFGIVRTLNRDAGTSFLLAEQNATQALKSADHGYILENGRVVASGTSDELRARDDVQHFYLGVGDRARATATATRH